MAKKINKKVAIVGSIFFVLVALGIIFILLHFLQGPEKYIADGDAILKKAESIQDVDERLKKYDEAVRCYMKARGRAKTDEQKIELLVKVASVQFKAGDWRKILSCWEGILRLDPQYPKALYGKMKYFYLVADSGAVSFWKMIDEQATDFIGKAKDDLLRTDINQLDVFSSGDKMPVSKLGAFLYYARGKARLQRVLMRDANDVDQLTQNSIDDLTKVLEYEPNNIDAQLQLIEALLVKGSMEVSKGTLNAQEQTNKEVQPLLEKAVGLAQNDSRPAVMFLNFQMQNSQAKSNQDLEVYEKQFNDIANKYSSDPYAYNALADYYNRIFGYKKLDKVFESLDKAIELDKENVFYYNTKASLYYQKFDITKQKEYFNRTIEILQTALQLPGTITKDKFSPGAMVKRSNRIKINSLLAFCYIGQILKPADNDSKNRRDEWVKKAEEAVYDISQLFDSGQDPQVVKWQGLLELAKGDADSAVKKLYSAYEQLKGKTQQSGVAKTDPQVAYALGNYFKDTAESGAAVEFLAAAVRSDIYKMKPTALLDCAEVLLMHRDTNNSLYLVKMFEDNFGVIERSKIIKIKIYISARQYEDALGYLEKFSESKEDPNKIKLKIELMRNKIGWSLAQKQKYEDPNDKKVVGKESASDNNLQQVVDDELKSQTLELKNLIVELLSLDANSINQYDTMAVVGNLINQNNIEEAKKFVDTCLQYFPNSLSYQIYAGMLKEKDPKSISSERVNQIKENIYVNLTDKLESALQLGLLYTTKNEPNKAIEEYKKVLSLSSGKDVGSKKEARAMAMQNVFDLALMAKNWVLADEILAKIKEDNLDRCGGSYFAARLNYVKGEMEQSLQNINECLNIRPIFSSGYMLRSTINASLGKETEAIADARKASAYNPLEGRIAKLLANLLYSRDLKLGSNTSVEQSSETEMAFNKALALNFNDPGVKSMYAEYIGNKTPEKALAIRQQLLSQSPSLENTFLLCRMAMNMAVKETDESKKKMFYETAESALNIAIKMAPKENAVLNLYAQYCQLTGQPQKAEKLITDSNNPILLWTFYGRSGDFGKAKSVLLDLYKKDSKNPDTLKGLISISAKQKDSDGVKKYSEELIAVQDNVDNRLNQAQEYIACGFIKEAESKLQSLREKYPQDSRAILIEAWIKMDAGQIDQSFELINKVLENNQNDPVALKIRGNLNLMSAKYTEAISDFEKSRLLSDEVQTKYLLAKAYFKNNETEKAITTLKNTINDTQATMEIWLFLEQLYTQGNKVEELRSFYGDCIKKFPNSVQWLNKAGEFAANMQDYQKAEQLFANSWNIGKKTFSPDSQAALYDYLRVLSVQGKINELLEESNAYLDTEYAPIAYVGMAEGKIKNGDAVKAAEFCRKAVDKAQSNQQLSAWALSKVYELLGPEQVEQICTELLQKDPDAFAPNYTMFGMASIKKDYNKGLQYITKCIEVLGPNNPETLQLIVNKTFMLERLYAKTSDKNYLNDAIKEYESLIKRMPKNISILNNIAFLLAQNEQKLEDALNYGKQAYELSPDNPGVLDTYAFVLYKNGQYQEAEKYIQSAVQLFEKSQTFASADVYEHLGLIKEKLNKNSEALGAYKTSLELYTKSKSEKDITRLKTNIEKISSN